MLSNIACLQAFHTKYIFLPLFHINLSEPDDRLLLACQQECLVPLFVNQTLSGTFEYKFYATVQFSFPL